MKTLFHYAVGPKLQDMLSAYRHEGLEIVCVPEGQDEAFYTELADTEVLWHVLQPLRADMLRRAPKLKLIQKIGVGVNTIDLEYARAHNIAVCNMPGTNSRAVAEMTLLLMLSSLRRLPDIDHNLRLGRWAQSGPVKESLGEIGGQCVGFIGFGATPQILAPMLEAMDVRVVYSNRSRKNVPYPYLDFSEVIETADIISLHLPLNKETKKIINAEILGRMKPGAILVNTARGGLVDEAALVGALKSGHLAAAGLDVFDTEPLTQDNRF